MSSTFFEPDSSSSGRRLCIQVCYGTFYVHLFWQSSRYKSVFDNFMHIGRSSACNRRATDTTTQVEAHRKAAGLLPDFSCHVAGTPRVYHLRLKIVAGFRGDMQDICLKLEESFQQDILLVVHNESW